MTIVVEVLAKMSVPMARKEKTKFHFYKFSNWIFIIYQYLLNKCVSFFFSECIGY